MANSRMKDFYDVWFLATKFSFDGARVCDAIGATFDRRDTPLPKETPLALTGEFLEDRAKQTQWGAFLRKTGVQDAKLSLGTVIESLREFLWPPTVAVTGKTAFSSRWSAGGPWVAIDLKDRA